MAIQECSEGLVVLLLYIAQALEATPLIWVAHREEDKHIILRTIEKVFKRIMSMNKILEIYLHRDNVKDLDNSNNSNRKESQRKH